MSDESPVVEETQVDEDSDVHPDAYPGAPEITCEAARERFYEKFKINDDGCWIWQASRNDDGYGWFWDSGRERMTRAHRVAWRIHHGAIPEGWVVTHTCDQPSCTNPGHLQLDTQQANLRAAAMRGAKGRDPEEVAEIVRRYRAGESPADLAREHDCARQTIWRYIYRERYAYLTLPGDDDD